jgi:hypothetical protein
MGALMLAGMSACGAVQTVTLIPPAKPVPPDYFGIHNHRFHDPAMRPTLNFGTWRLWDAGVGWSQLQPRKDEWKFGRLDFALEVARAKGYEVLLTFGRTPAWAAAKPGERSFYGVGEASPPRDMADFAQFVREVATRYAGKISLYEVWNEPASSGMFSGSVAQMVEMTQIVGRELRRVDPVARLVCPSPAKHESLRWFERFVAAGGADGCDIIGYHFYTDSGQPEAKLNLIAEVKAILKTYGLASKPLWDTESGHAIGVTRFADTPSADAASHVARWLILNWAAGVERFYWYSWDHERLGFINPAGAKRDRAQEAYTRAQRWMLGSRFNSCGLQDNVWRCNLTLIGGEQAQITWTQDNRPVEIAIATGARVVDIYGYEGQPNRDRIVVKGSPVLIVNTGFVKN